MISKQAKREYDKLYNIRNKAKRRQYYIDNAESFREKTRQFLKNNPNYTKKYNLAHREKKAITQRIYRNKNIQNTIEKRRQYNIKYKEKSKEYSSKNREIINKRSRDRKRVDLNYKLICDFRSRMTQLIRRNSKSSTTLNLLGCSIEYFKEYLESKFTRGMSWNNRGIYGWHIDHILPCASFNLSKAEEQRKCFHYTNLQPLWATDNLRKHTKII